MTTTLRVLLVEDNATDAMLVEARLKRHGYTPDITRVQDGKAMQDALATDTRWDIVISDYALPSFNGLEALAILKESGRDLPFILVSGAIGEETAVAAMKAGAQDYLLKDSLARLGPVVERECREAESRRQRRKAEAALREREARYALMVESTQMAVYDWDFPSGTIHWNDAYYTQLGLPPAPSVPFERFFALLHPEDREPVRTSLQAHLDDATVPYDLEFRLRHNEGHYITIHSRGRCLRNTDGEPLRLIGVAEDISTRKELEALTRRAKDAAEEASARKSRLIANLSHEFKTPLNAILAYAQLLEEKNAQAQAHDGKQHLYASHIRTGGEHLLAMVNELLDIARIEGQGLTLNLQEDVPLGKLLDEVMAIIEPMANSHGIRLITKVPPPSTTICADSHRLRQVLINLLSNAIKFNREQGVVELSVYQTPDEGAAHFSVRDTGIGIPADNLGAIFEPFYQVDSSNSRPHNGVGLGLALAKHLVELHGGTLAVTSIEGDGSTFSFELPCRQAQAPYNTVDNTSYPSTDLKRQEVAIQ